MAIWADLKMGCPACVAEGREAGPATQWYHAVCGGRMEVSDEARLKCGSCRAEDHIQNWRWGCPKHGDPAHEDYYRPTNASSVAAQISVAAAVCPKMGKAWLMRFLDNLGEW